VLLGTIAPSQTQTAIANGDTRTLNLYHSHTGESINATFRVNGVYDSAVLEKLNWFLRDWRNNDATRMDPRLFDIVWEVYRTAGATDPIVIFSAYRSPATNAMLRRRSRGVAEHSQHMVGRAMDTTMPGMSMQRIREIGIKLQRGGVGYYPGSNFVHLDVGGVRAWPRLGYDQLVRLFPDGKTVHLASNGKALPRNAEARAELAARGGVSVAMAAPDPSGLFSWLFGGGRDAARDADSARPAPTRRDRVQTAALARRDAARATPDDAATTDDGRTAQDRRTTQDRRHGQASVPGVVVASLAQPRSADEVPAGTAASHARGVPTPTVRPSFAQAPTDVPESASGGTTRQGQVTATAPLPPPRPEDRSVVAHVLAEVPEPPRRPGRAVRLASLAEPPSLALGVTTEPASSDVTPDQAVLSQRAEPISGAEPISRAATLPFVITQGLNDQPKVPTQVLAYAPTTRFVAVRSDGPDPAVRPQMRKPVPAPQTPTVPGRLDRSNFRSLTGGTATASLVSQSLLGPSVAGLRQAARVTSDILSPIPSIGYVATFGTGIGDLDSSGFSGAATKPLAAAPGLVRIMESQMQYASRRSE
jgi:uncharacterized protein YcbK (DUF882 family)